MESTEIADESDGLWWTIPKQKTKGLHNEKATDLRVPLVGRAEVIVRRRLDQAKGTVLFPSSRGKTMDPNLQITQDAFATAPLSVGLLDDATVGSRCIHSSLVLHLRFHLPLRHVARLPHRVCARRARW